MADEAVELGVALIDVAKIDDTLAHVGSELITEWAARHADDGEPLGKKIRLKEVKQRREQLALGEVARCAKDDENAWLGNALSGCWDLGKIFGAHSHLHGRHI